MTIKGSCGSWRATGNVMKKKLFLFALLVFGYIYSYGQEITKELKTEEDGFKWFWLYSKGSVGAQDVNGKELVPLSKQFNGVGYRTDLKVFQITVFKDDDIKTGWYSLDGKELIAPDKYDVANYWNEEDKPKFFIVEKGNLCGVCNKDGKEVIPLLYDKVFHSNDNYFVVYKGDYRGICDINGKFTIPLSNQFTLILYEKETDCYAIHKGDKLRGVCKKDGSFLIPLSRGYELCNYEKEGWYQIKKNGYYGVCDLSGKEVVKPDKYTSFFIYDDDKGVYTYDANYKSITLYKPKKKANSNVSNNYASNSTYSTTNNGTPSIVSEIKELFDLAYNTPDTEAQTKYDRYMKVIQADPYNSYGYKAPAYNNLGVLYESLGDLKNAKACYEYALQANPNYDKAKQNLKNVKAQRRSQRWNNIGNALGAVGQTLGTMNGNQTGGSYNTYPGGSGSYGSGSTGGGGSTSERTCVSCGGSGKCSAQGWADKYRCHGSGRCQHCNNTGTQRDYGQTRVCSTCNGTKKCHYCGGSGRCSTCGGTGKR